MDEKEKNIIVQVEEDDENISVLPSPASSSPSPWVLMYDKRNKGKLTCMNFREGSYYSIDLPELHEIGYIWSFMDGWVLSEDVSKTNNKYLINLMSIEKVKLPSFKSSAPCTSRILSAPPTVDGCRVHLYEGYNDMILFHCEPGAEKFEEKTLELDNVYSIMGSGIIFEGKIYGLDTYDLVVANITNPSRFELVWGRDDVQFSTYFGIPCLVECGGELLIVFRGDIRPTAKDILEIQVFQADFSHRRWVEKNSIGDYAIFINEFQGVACSAGEDDECRRNCVYYTRPNDRDVYAFDLEDKSITVLPTLPPLSSRQTSLYWTIM